VRAAAGDPLETHAIDHCLLPLDLYLEQVVARGDPRRQSVDRLRLERLQQGFVGGERALLLAQLVLRVTISRERLALYALRPATVWMSLQGLGGAPAPARLDSAPARGPSPPRPT
jgi:hypothetical protein